MREWIVNNANTAMKSGGKTVKTARKCGEIPVKDTKKASVTGAKI